MTVRDIWHVGFVVADIEQAITFYADGLGLRLRHRQVQENAYTCRLVGYPDVRLLVAQFDLPTPSRGASGHVLEIIQYVRPEGVPAEPEHNRVATGHLALEVGDIDTVRARLEALGADFLSETLDITEGINAGGRVVYLRAPDGVALELVQPPTVPGAPAVI